MGQTPRVRFQTSWHIDLQGVAYILVENSSSFWIKLVHLSVGWVFNVSEKSIKKIIMKQALDWSVITRLSVCENDSCGFIIGVSSSNGLHFKRNLKGGEVFGLQV